MSHSLLIYTRSHHMSLSSNKNISIAYHHSQSPNMQSQSGFNDAKDIMKPTNPLSPRRRVLGELSANSRRKVSPSSTKCIHSSFNSPAQRKSPIQSCLKSSTLSPTAPPKRSAAHIINTVEGAENQAGNTIHTSDNNSKKRSIDQVNSLVPEQPSGRTSMRHTPSVSMSLLENENAMSDDKDPEESLDSAKASTRTSQMTQIDHGASATKAINNYATSDEALAGDETNAIAGARTATKAVRKINLTDAL